MGLRRLLCALCLIEFGHRLNEILKHVIGVVFAFSPLLFTGSQQDARGRHGGVARTTVYLLHADHPPGGVQKP